jgi:uncharacterized protein
MSQDKTQTSSPQTKGTMEIDNIEALKSLPLALQTELEAAAFRRLVKHLQERTDVQNIELMNLAGFCRNCLSKWYRSEADQRGISIEDLTARENIYGMPYAEWKSNYQK